MTTKQIETATVIGSCTGDGTALVTVTSARIATNPTAVSVALLATDDTTASLVAAKCRTALALNSVISDVFQVSGATDKIILTERSAHANDATLNIAVANGSCTGLTAAPTSTDTQAGDGLDNAYISLADIKANGALGITDTTNDVELEAVINATSRALDDFCNQYFYKNSVDEVRYYTPSQWDQCVVDPLVSITEIKNDSALDRTYADTWVAGTDYDLYPYNATLDGMAYWRIDLIHGVSNFQFVKGRAKSVKITGVFGWPAVPVAVQQATLLWAMRVWLRHKTVLGVSAMGPLGQQMVKVPGPDPDIAEMLSHYHLEMTGSW